MMKSEHSKGWLRRCCIKGLCGAVAIGLWAQSPDALAALEQPTVPASTPAFTPASVPAARSDLLNNIADQSVAPFMQNACHVGLSMALVRGDQTRFFNYGLIARGTHSAPTADSLYEIASVTKTFTGVLAARALVQHRLSLDADFRAYLPGKYPNLTWQDHPITLRTLADHRSGLPRDLPDTDDLYAHRDPETLPYKLIARDIGYDTRRYLHALHTVRLRSEPGEEEQYSNLGFKVIGWGLESVYHQSYETLLQEAVLKPLHMDSSGFAPSPAQRAALVKGYSPAGHVMPYHLRNAGAAYGLYSTPRDLAQYLRWQLNESDPVIRTAHQLIWGSETEGEALVWHVAVIKGSPVLWHGGGTFGMSSQLVLFPERKEGYALLANDACSGTEGALRDLALAIHDRWQ